jgi:hypothetical protein
MRVEKVGFARDSPLEGTGFEPLVPQKALGVLAVSVLVRADSSSAGMKRHISCFRNRGRVARYRRFESDFFQRRVWRTSVPQWSWLQIPAGLVTP